MLNVLKSLFDVKKLLMFTVFAAAIYLYGCGSDTTAPVTNVTFAMSSAQGANGIRLIFQSSVDIKLTAAVVSVPAQNFIDTVENANPQYVFSKDTAYGLVEDPQIVSGQAWTLRFIGTTVSGNSAYDVTTNYTIP